MFACEIRHAIEAATRLTLPQVTALLWRAYGEGKITETEAEALSGLIEARQTSAGGPNSPQSQSPTGSHPDEGGDIGQARVGSSKRTVGSRPRTDASLERRRRWAASGRLPPGLAARFTLAEQAVLALVAAETVRRKDCRLSVGHLAAIVGVAETTVRNAIREAMKLGLVTVEERRITGFRNDTNIVRIVSREWAAWLRLARKGVPRSEQALATMNQGGGCKSVNRTTTQVLILSESGTTEPKKGCREAAGDLTRATLSRIRAGRGTGRAMR
ncbi:MAG: helix-turn-helix domain-containing protein [Methylobacterium sp.]|uniref:helix-turn-helix domain-containing protein n=1 Tax=Methylobacterium sp. TaxID=409 RepID=UPI0025FE8ABD|nr:helix-turn-helix domain-containing protein [Methylobacterium sp.]MBX9934796.1 helix-turn-helix domain-containing protein [Methylobacterium sp.]